MTHRELVTDEAVRAAWEAAKRDILAMDVRGIVSAIFPTIAKKAQLILLDELIEEASDEYANGSVSGKDLLNRRRALEGGAE